MTKEEVKKKICDTIDANKDKLYEIGNSIFQNPELGYKEVKTSALVRKTFDEIGLKHQDNLVITGVKAKLFDDRTEGHNV